VNGSENDFDPLQAGLGRMSREAGACPNAETLAAFAANLLPPDESSRIQAHVSACGICDSLVEDLRGFDDPATETMPGWAMTERRLRKRVFPKPRWWSWVLHPAVAYGITLATVTVAALAIRLPAAQAVIAPSPIEMQSLRTIDLNTERGGGVPQPALDSGDKLVLLSFLIDVHPAFRYQASLDGHASQTVLSSDGRGNFEVLVSRDLLGSGAHRLTVTEIDPASGKVERSFAFPFDL
jgi:hypothetical protein